MMTAVVAVIAIIIVLEGAEMARVNIYVYIVVRRGEGIIAALPGGHSFFLYLGISHMFCL